MTRLHTNLLVPLAAAAICLLAACGGGGNGGALSLDPVAKAADTTQKTGSFRASFDATVAAPTARSVRMTGKGTFDARRHTGRMAFDLGGLPAQAGEALGGPLHIDAVFDAFDVYMKLPSQVMQALPGGKGWLKIDLRKAAEGQGVNFQQLSQLNQGDPSQVLRYLRASSGNVDNLGKEEIRGVETTHYRTVVDLQKVPDSAPKSQRAAVRRSIQSLMRETGARNFPVDVWIDAANRLRRMKMTMSFAAKATTQKVRMSFREDLYDFGVNAKVEPPPASDVLDLTRLGGS